MTDISQSPRLKRLEIVNCQGLSDDQIMDKVLEIVADEEKNGEDDVLHLMLNNPLTATLEDSEDNKQTLTITFEEISDEELSDLQEKLIAVREYYTELDVVLIRNKNVTLEEASRILSNRS